MHELEAIGFHEAIQNLRKAYEEFSAPEVAK